MKIEFDNQKKGPLRSVFSAATSEAGYRVDSGEVFLRTVDAPDTATVILFANEVVALRDFLNVVIDGGFDD
jgi:hypothetical protein